MAAEQGSRLRLRLFGHMTVDDIKGRSYLPRTRKTRALLAILAIASPKPVLRLQLASLLWSRRETEQARASLRQSVHELQDTLSPTWSHVFVTDRHHLSLRGDDLDVDALTLAQCTSVSTNALARFEALLLEDLNGLDPAFDRWLDDERGRFLRIGRTIGENLLAQCDEPVASIEAAYIAALGLMDRPREAGKVLSRLLALEPGFSVREAVERSPWTRAEDTARYADGLRRAGLRDGGDSTGVTIRHTLIDLVPEAPHSPQVGTKRFG